MQHTGCLSHNLKGGTKLGGTKLRSRKISRMSEYIFYLVYILLCIRIF